MSYAPMAAVAGSPAALHSTATELRKLVSYIGGRESELMAEMRASTAIWSGGAGDAYRAV